jgi:DNA repair exonuclease SbcCD ATPase subunit
MQMKDWMKTTLLAAGLCLAALQVYAQQQDTSQQTGDPVADAARKAREAKKNAAKPKRVFTDDDVKPAAPEKPPAPSGAQPTATSGAEGAAATAGASTAQKAGDATKTDATAEKEDPNGEKAWRRRFSEQRDKIAKAEKELDVLQRELEKAQTQYYSDPQKAMDEQNNRGEINDKTAKIDAKKKELEQLRQQLDDMESDLRKSGGNPGWAR